MQWPILAAPVLFVVVAKSIGLYDRDQQVLHKTTLDEVPRLFALATVSTLFIWLCDGLITKPPLDQAQVVALWAILLTLLASLRALVRATVPAVLPPERCLLIGEESDAEMLRTHLKLARSVRAEVVGLAPLSSADSRDHLRLPPQIDRIVVDWAVDRVIVARPPGALEGTNDLVRTLRKLGRYGVRISLLPRLPRISGPVVEVDQLPGLTLLGVHGLEIARSSLIVKRTFDLVAASVGIVLLFPLLAVIAGAIKLDSPGPILFRHRRVGRQGREFATLKFRSMIVGAHELEPPPASNGDRSFKEPDDPRVTRVGHVLRRTSLDELPQLWNILRGEMSLVGPRPLTRREEEVLEELHHRRLMSRPGMTGYWQIHDTRRELTLKERAKLDQLYLANWTLWSDIQILLRTVPYVLGRRGI